MRNLALQRLGTHPVEAAEVVAHVAELHQRTPRAVDVAIERDFAVVGHAEAVFVGIVAPVRVDLPLHLGNAILKAADVSYEAQITLSL